MTEDRALEELSKVMLRVNEQQAVRDESARLLREEMHYFEKKHRDDFTIDFFKMYDLYIERLASDDEEAQEKLQAIRPELDAAREKVVEASRQRRIVEQLKERQRDRYLEEVRRQERKELDEYNLLRSSQPLTQSIYEIDRSQPESKPTVAELEAEELRELERERKTDDLIAQYYQQLGIPDPRER